MMESLFFLRYDNVEPIRYELLFVCLLSFSALTRQTEINECCVWFQCLAQWRSSFLVNVITCEYVIVAIVYGYLLCIFFLLSPQLRLIAVSAVFDFSPSLNDVAPVSPILLPVDVMRKEKSELLVDDFGVFFLFCLHSTNWYKLMTCLISTPHSMMLPLCFQCHCLLVILKGLVNCWRMSFVCLLSFVFTTQVECRECCVWFQCLTQWCYSCVSNLAHCWYE